MNKTLAFVLMLISAFSFAQEQTSFSLKEAEDYGINNNEKVKNALLDLESAEKRIWETTAIGLPQVKAEGNFQNLIDIPTQVVDATLFNPLAPPGTVMEFQMGQKYSTSLTFNVNQLIFDGSYVVGLKFAKFWKKMNENGVERSKSEIRTMVREAYYNVLVTKKNVEVLDSILVATEKLQQQTQVLFDNGFLLKEDADQIKLTLNKINTNKRTAEKQVEIATNLLKLQMGYDFDQPLSVTDELDKVLEEILVESPVQKQYSIQDNSNYQMLSEQKTLDEFNVMNEKAGYYPSVGAFFQHSQNAYRNEFDFFQDKPWYPTTIWGIGVQIPITTSGMKVMKVQQAEIKVEQDANNIQNLERSIKFQELQLKAQFQIAYDQMIIEKENVELAKFIYSQALKKQTAGAVSSLEVTQLQNQLLQAQGVYISSVLNLLDVKVQLDKLFNQ
ncbi:TolC family protein [Paracrocinitomix mangrovi]|uniref:TolC family protein n=1 Tax=Paracrocinitomix mangrovi TaxID=2862509 RepID=UPI001C8DDED8|nr:TolC family protein [Paracrocinitomix mangrovi]UKN01950.1 TolC family protein [Paracrocinitomix mangrovi]